MAIDYNKGQLPKAPSNSTNMGAMPGTQQTAIQNVNTGANINPNMPSAPQLAKQSKSSFQQGLMKTPAPKMPAASAPPRTPMPADRIVAQGQAMAPGRGYNIFSGMGAGDISQMNQSMGLSNMSSLPSPAGPDVGATTLSQPQRQTNRFLMSGEGSGSYPDTVNINGQTMAYDESTGLYYGTGNASGVSYDPESGDLSVQWSASGPATKYQVGQVVDKIEEEEEEDEGLGYEKVDSDKVAADALAATEAETIGINPEQKQEMFDNLDQEYSLKLEQVLAGLDRQAAMMGTFGSGAHMANVNNAISQALANMADEYNEINKLDIQTTEVDHQQLFANQLGVAGLSEQQATNAMNMLTQIDQNLVTSMGDYITTYAPNEEVAAELTGLLADTVADGYSKVDSGEWTMSEYTAKLKMNFALAQAGIMAANGDSEGAKSFLDQRFGDIINPFADDLPGAQEYLKNTLGVIFGGPLVGKVFGFNMAKDIVEDVAGLAVDAWNSIFG
tara:strand:- start:258 stop:1760 length:1503 start_codon:yes stop_codon:yes gene_type:complete